MTEAEDTDRSLSHSGSTDHWTELHEYLGHATATDLGDVVEVLCAHQVERWRHRERVPVEAYLRLHPPLQEDSQAAFELIYGEFVLREHLGEAPSVREFQWRFPEFTKQL